MKFILFFLAISFLTFSKAYAVESQALNYGEIPEYLGTEVIPLTEKEKKALKLSSSWARKGADPILTPNGKLVYTHGASLITVLASPMQICDVELQEGENINEIILGDSARWFVEKGQAHNTTHLFIKPLDIGLETSAVITTDRRVYRLRLISSKTDFTPYIGFIYNDDFIKFSAEKEEQKIQEKLYSTTKIDGKQVDLASLNFAYTLSGDYTWKPTRIYDDDFKTYIQFPKKSSSDMPILLARKNRQNTLVNYRVKDNVMIADGIFKELILVLGVGKHKEEIRIKRN